MKTINLSGEVGWEITDRLVSSLLPKDGKEDVTISINSYGGSIFEGFAIYNTIKSYPGNVTTVIKSIAASAASVIFLAGKKRAIYKNSTFMSHPVWSCICGDGDEMIAEGKVLNDLTGIIAEDLAGFMGKEKSEVMSDLKNEIWLIGWEQIVNSGVADDVIDQPASADDGGATETIEHAAAMIKEIQNKMKNEEEKIFNAETFKKVAASIAARVPEPIQDSTPMGEKIITEENSMDKTTLKTEAPEVYDAIFDEGKSSVDVKAAIEAAVKADRENTATLLKLKGIDKETIENCTSGMSAGDFAIAEVEKRNQIQNAVGDNELTIGLTAGNQLPANSKVDEANAEADKWGSLYDKKEKEDK